MRSSTPKGSRPRATRKAPGKPGVKGRGGSALTEPGETDRRLGHLYEISRLFASFDDAEQPLDAVLGVVTKTLFLHSAILIEIDGDRSRMIVWPAVGQSPEQMRSSKSHAKAGYAYLGGAASTEPLDLAEEAGLTPLPRQAQDEGGSLPARYIVIPLVVAHQRPFGVLQLEGANTFVEADLMYLNAIGNQLAIALDRDRAWRWEISRRWDAEEERVHAETAEATAERGRVLAESSSDRHKALAAENSRLYKQARQAVQAREHVLAVVSHDLRNPLGTILLTGSALTRKGSPEDRQRGLRIEQSAARMLRLIDDLVDFASIEAGRLAIKQLPEDAGAMLAETLASFESVAREKRLGLNVEMDSQLPSVCCDRGRILQVLGNLVGNATKVTAEGGHVTVRADVQGHEIRFEVADDGPGIDEGDVDHLFERYWRSDQADYKGTGLGLAIAQGIVGAHAGRIWVQSVLGRGTSFFFTLPTVAIKSTRAP